jgi:sugar phosphate isomerase/epimerase
MKSAITISLVPESAGGPFVFQGDLAGGFARAARHGFNAVEIFPASPDDLKVGEIKRLCETHRLKIAAIGSGGGWVKHRLSLTSPDGTTRKNARAFIRAIIDVAGGLGAPIILGSMQGRWDAVVQREQALEWLAGAMEDLAPRAETHGVPLLYEFLNRYETNLFNRVDESLQFLQTLRTQNVKLLCDLFHMNIEETDIPAALKLAGAKVGHIHFADSNRRAVGMGHTPMKPIIAALQEIGYKGYLSAEVFPFPDGHQAAARTIASLRDLTQPRNR